MIDFTIIELSNGWVQLSITLDNYSWLCCFENVPNDALSDILLTATRFVGGAIDTKVVFPNGSQKAEMIIKASDNLQCQVVFDSIQAIVPVKQFIRTVIRMFDKYVHGHSVEEYNSGWSHFPSEELARLRANYHG